MQSYSAYACKVCKKCYYEPEHFFVQNIHMGTKIFFADFIFLDGDLNQSPLKAIAQKLCKF